MGFAAESIGKIFPKSCSVTLTCGRPAVKERLFEQPYFYDGKRIVIITINDTEFTCEPERALRKRGGF